MFITRARDVSASRPDSFECLWTSTKCQRQSKNNGIKMTVWENWIKLFLPAPRVGQSIFAWLHAFVGGYDVEHAREMTKNLGTTFQLDYPVVHVAASVSRPSLTVWVAFVAVIDVVWRPHLRRFVKIVIAFAGAVCAIYFGHFGAIAKTIVNRLHRAQRHTGFFVKIEPSISIKYDERKSVSEGRKVTFPTGAV